MPLKRCTKDGKRGWKFGDSGACYTGKDGKKQAIRQGLAILGPEKFKKEMQKGKGSKGSDQDLVISQEEFEEALKEYEQENQSYTDSIIERVAEHLKDRGHS